MSLEDRARRAAREEQVAATAEARRKLLEKQVRDRRELEAAGRIARDAVRVWILRMEIGAYTLSQLTERPAELARWVSIGTAQSGGGWESTPLDPPSYRVPERPRRLVGTLTGDGKEFTVEFSLEAEADPLTVLYCGHWASVSGGWQV